jgi:hypothetical protein
MKILCNTLLKLGGTNYHFRRVKIPGTTSYLKAWVMDKRTINDKKKLERKINRLFCYGYLSSLSAIIQVYIVTTRLIE